MYDKSCIDCHNLRTKKLDGSIMVYCKFHFIKKIFVEKITDVGNNAVDEAVFKIQANKCKKYLLDMEE